MSFTVHPLDMTVRTLGYARDLMYAWNNNYFRTHFKRTRVPKGSYIQYNDVHNSQAIAHDKLFDQKVTDQLIAITLERESLREAMANHFVSLYEAHGEATVDNIGRFLHSLEEEDQLDGISLRRVDVSRYTDEVQDKLIL